MLVHRHRRPRYAMQLPLTSLIDIVFLLLIYFMLTTNFMVDEGINIALPQARSGAPQTRQEIIIHVDREGRAFWAGEEIPADQLFGKLKTLIGSRPGQMVVVKADRAVILNQAVKVMDMAKAAGAASLCLATEKDF